MAVKATWHVTVARLDSSRLHFAIFRGQIPVIGAIETVRSDDAVGLEGLKFKVLSKTHHRTRAAGLGVYDITAKELK